MTCSPGHGAQRPRHRAHPVHGTASSDLPQDGGTAAPKRHHWALRPRCGRRWPRGRSGPARGASGPGCRRRSSTTTTPSGQVLAPRSRRRAGRWGPAHSLSRRGVGVFRRAHSHGSRRPAGRRDRPAACDGDSQPYRHRAACHSDRSFHRRREQAATRKEPMGTDAPAAESPGLPHLGLPANPGLAARAASP